MAAYQGTGVIDAGLQEVGVIRHRVSEMNFVLALDISSAYVIPILNLLSTKSRVARSAL